MQTGTEKDKEGNVKVTHYTMPADRPAARLDDEMCTWHAHPPLHVRQAGLHLPVSNQNAIPSALQTMFPGRQAAAGQGSSRTGFPGNQTMVGARTGFVSRSASVVGRGSGSGTGSPFVANSGSGTRSGFGTGSALVPRPGYGTRSGYGGLSGSEAMGSGLGLMGTGLQVEMPMNGPNTGMPGPPYMGMLDQYPYWTTMQSPAFPTPFAAPQTMPQDAVMRHDFSNFVPHFATPPPAFNGPYLPPPNQGAYHPAHVMQPSTQIGGAAYNQGNYLPNPVRGYGGPPLPAPTPFTNVYAPRAGPPRLQTQSPVKDHPASPEAKPKKRTRKPTAKALQYQPTDDEDASPPPESKPKKRRARKSGVNAAEEAKKSNPKNSKVEKVKAAQKLAAMASLPATSYAYEAGLLPGLLSIDEKDATGPAAGPRFTAPRFTAPSFTAPTFPAPTSLAPGITAGTFGNLSDNLPLGTNIIPFESGEHEVALQESFRENGIGEESVNATNTEEVHDDPTIQLGDRDVQPNVYEGYIPRQTDDVDGDDPVTHDPTATTSQPAATDASSIGESEEVMLAKYRVFSDYFFDHFQHDQTLLDSFTNLVNAFQSGQIREIGFYTSIYQLVYMNDSPELTAQYHTFLPKALKDEGFRMIQGRVATHVEECRAAATQEEIAAMEAAFEQKIGKKKGRKKKAPVNGFRTGDHGVSGVNGAANPDAAEVPSAFTGQGSTQEASHQLRRPISIKDLLASDHEDEEPEQELSSDGEYSPVADLKNSNGKLNVRDLYSAQVPHVGKLHKTRREILTREDRPFICGLCGEDFKHPTDVSVHHGGTRPAVQMKGCWAKHGKPTGAGAQWNSHGSCKVGLKDIKYTRVKDGFVILDHKSMEKIEAACEVGRKFKKDNGML